MEATCTAMWYDASRDADGTLTVHRVPIFCACERGDVQFDDAWISQAVNKAKQHEREGYMAPLHIRHHEPTATGNVRESLSSGALPLSMTWGPSFSPICSRHNEAASAAGRREESRCSGR